MAKRQREKMTNATIHQLKNWNALLTYDWTLTIKGGPNNRLANSVKLLFFFCFGSEEILFIVKVEVTSTLHLTKICP